MTNARPLLAIRTIRNHLYAVGKLIEDSNHQSRRAIKVCCSRVT